ncbi:T3SS (YopN, CesT) and YbjN peptide-binding chaperone 1 [Micromonospora sp. NPDC004704]
MTPPDGFFRRLAWALAAQPSTTTASVPLPTRTRLAAALAARPITQARGLVDLSAWPGDKITDQVRWVVAQLLGTTADQLRVDSDGDIGIRAGSAIIFVRAQEDPPLVDVFSPLLTGVQPTESLYRRLSDLTNGMVIGRIYCTGDTIWASVPVFGEDFQPTHLLLAIQAMIRLADDLDDHLHQEFGGSRFFGAEASGLTPVPDPTGYLRDLADSGESRAGRVLADLLADRGRVEELRIRAESGNGHAATRLAALLLDQGHTDEAEHFWRLAVGQGEPNARPELADLLVADGRVEEAISLLRGGPEDDWRSVGLLLALLAKQGRTDEALDLLRSHTPGSP